MTAEIAILNKLGVALAADSAVTIQDTSKGEVKKIYNTTNKLFTLSKYHPVGIMVYGNAQLLGTPWEVIIKIYRQKLGDRRFDTLKEYSSDFIIFLNDFFSLTEQEGYFYASVAGYFYNLILKEIDNSVEKITHEKGNIEQSQIVEFIDEIINKHYQNLMGMKTLDCFPKNFSNQLSRKYKSLLDKVIGEVFEKLPLSSENTKMLRQIGVLIGIKDIFSGGTSGIVVAGFGNKQIFPELFSINVDGIINGRIKYAVSHDTKIDANNEAVIIPFAQQEMVNTFMEGIDPDFRKLIDAYIKQILEQYPHTIIDNLSSLSLEDGQKQQVLGVLLDQSGNIMEKFKDDLENYTTKAYVDPIISTVGSLPKDELAAMAESLVNLTSFKRRVSMDAETVGGPIDVAVISKGDGFIWIKRKHYFTPELNPQFFKNYYES